MVTQVRSTEVLNDRTVLLSLTMARLGNTRKVSSTMVDVDADKDAIHVGKELLSSAELTQICAHDGLTRRWVYDRALPAEVLKSGIYRLPIGLVGEVDAKMGELSKARQVLVDKFLAAYLRYVQEAQVRLRVLYRESDYAPVERVAGAFYFRWRYLMLDVPESLSTVSDGMYQRELAKIREDLGSEAQEIKMALRVGFAEMLDHAISRLSSKDGKKVIFRDSLIENMAQFFRYFNERNVLDDRDLAGLVERSRKAMNGLTAEELRKNDSVRETVRNSFVQVRTIMDENLMLAPTRRIKLEDVEG